MSRRREKLIHRAWDWRRTRYIPGWTERIFADRWEEACDPHPGINHGFGTLQDMLIDTKGSGIFSRKRVVAWITNREAMIVATIIQWLGTNCGFCWLSETLRKAGYNIIKENEDRDCASARFEFSAQNSAILTHFKKTMQMERMDRMASIVGMTDANFKKAFKYLCDVGLCEVLIRGPKKEKFASVTREGVELLQYAQFENSKGNLCLRARMPLRWLESTKLPFEFAESAEAKPEPVSKVSREERIEAIKAAQQERINARKFGELQSV